MARPEWKVLSVDDDPDMHDGLKGILSSRMEDERFDFTCATSFDEGMELIRKNRFDLIFLDVYEDSGDPNASTNPNQENQRGEQLLNNLKTSRFVPVIFYTGFPAKVDHLKSHVVKVVEKGATPSDVRAAVSSILKTGLPQLTQYIEEQSRAYIWESLESVLKTVDDDNVTSDIALLAARNLAKNLSQKSIKELLGADANHIAPLEMYLYPPVQGTCNPADIYRNKQDDSRWMILTPACDFEQNKAQNVLMAQVTPLIKHELYKEWQSKESELKNIPLDNQSSEVKKTAVKARGNVKSLVKNRLGSRFRFLPGTFFLPDCIVDFQSLLNLPIVESKNYEVICSLDNPYREEFLQLFSSYYGRIGTPDYEFDPIWEKVDNAFTA